MMHAKQAWLFSRKSDPWSVFVFLSFLTSITFSLNACANTNSPNTIVVKSLVPTSHAGYSAAQATLEAGQAKALDLAIQSTMVALNLTQAAATETYFLQQTVRAQQATATAQAQEATAIQQAHLQGLTDTASVVQTQAAQATQTANAALTATAWPQTATPLAATQQVIIAQAEAAQRRAHWEQILIPLQVIAFSALGFTILILLVLGGVRAYRRLLPALEMRLRTFRRGPHDAPLFFLDDLIIDLDRNFGPALYFDHDGARTTGLAPSPQLQERLVARDQAVDLARTQPTGRSQRQVSSYETFPNINPEPARAVEIEIIDPKQVKPWLDEVENKLLPQGTEQKE